MNPKDYLIHSLEQALLNHKKDFLKAKNAAGEFEYIALKIDDFNSQVLRATSHLRSISRDQVKPSFVDVGCGIGSKVFLARQLGCASSTGIEITPKYVRTARRLFKKYPGKAWGYGYIDKCKIIQGDALQQDYAAYDIIYFYWPIFDVKKQIILENLIADTTKRGAVIIPNGTQAWSIWENKDRFYRVSDYVYEKL